MLIICPVCNNERTDPILDRIGAYKCRNCGDSFQAFTPKLPIPAITGSAKQLDGFEWMDQLFQEIRALVVQKHTAYGASLDQDGALGVIFRMLDKLRRLKNLLLKGGSENDESRQDTGLDFLGYAFHLVRLLREKRFF